MPVFRLTTIGASVIALAATGLVALAAPATAQPCGNGGIGSSGSSGLGSSGLGSSGDRAAQGPQGPLPIITSFNTKAIEWVTGPRSKNSTYDRFTISGTDLGIAWDNGSGQTLMAFGDTFGNCAVAGQQWRHNVLLRSEDTDLSDGITVPAGVPGDTRSGSVVAAADPRFALELIPAVGVDYIEVTTIPTAAIAVGNTQYINYMSVRSWGNAGQWVTNFSAIAFSHNNGQTWTTDTNTIRVNADITIPGVTQVNQDNDKFQMSAYLNGKDGYVYQYGTPNGRFGAAYLARFRPEDILDLTRYEYFTTNATNPWSTSGGNLKNVAPAPVSELSVAWNDYLNRYVMLYTSDPYGGLIMRTAENPEGPWSGAKVLIAASGLSGIYAPYVHPASSGKDLYFMASVWKDYNVMLLRTDLDKL